jgi:hypothetical protein
MAPFDPIAPPAPPAVRKQRTDISAVWSCPICGRCRFDPYSLAHEGAEVIASGEFATCGFCGDGCFR